MRKKNIILLSIIVFIDYLLLRANPINDASSQSYFSLPKYKYEIEAIKIKGAEFTDENYLKSLLYLKPGSEVLSYLDEGIAESVKNIISQDIVSDVTVYLEPTVLNKAILAIDIVEYPRLESLEIVGLKESEKEELLKLLKFVKDRLVSKSYIKEIKSIVKNYLAKEGYSSSNFEISSSSLNIDSRYVSIIINIKEAKERIIGDYIFRGLDDENIEDELLFSIQHNKPKSKFSVLKKVFLSLFTKKFYSSQNPVFSYFNPKKIFSFVRNNAVFLSSNFDKNTFVNDKNALLEVFRSKGYINAKINGVKFVSDAGGKYFNIVFDIYQGDVYRINRVFWNGLTLYDEKFIQALLKINSGRVYNVPAIKRSLMDIMFPGSLASFFYNRGYLSYSATVVETGIDFDKKTVDLNINVHEGEIYKLDKIIIQGNTMTFDKIILREVSTLPDQKFSGDALKMSYNHLVMLQLFDPAIVIQPLPNPLNKTFDMLYSVKEKPQLGLNLAGSLSFKNPTVHLKFNTNNVAVGNIFKGRVPLGANQSFGIDLGLSKDELKLSHSFYEPQISELYPISFNYIVGFGTSKVFKNIDEDSADNIYDSDDDLEEGFAFSDYVSKRRYIGKNKVVSSSIYLGKYIKGFYRTKASIGLSYSYSYYFAKCSALGSLDLLRGSLHDIHASFSIVKDTSNNPIFPTEGLHSSIRISSTLPYSLLGKGVDLEDLPDIDEFKFKEFVLYSYDFNYNYPLFKKLILSPQFFIGGLAGFQKLLGPFQRFSLGGAESSSSARILGGEHVRLRGYEDGELTPKYDEDNYGGGVFSTKISVEAKCPVIESHILHASIFSFIDAANCWNEYKKINILNMYRSIGFGLRVYVGIFLNSHIEFSLGYPLNPRGGKEPKFVPHVAFNLSR